MRKFLPVLLLTAALAGCIDSPPSPRKSPGTPSRAVTPNPAARQCMAQLSLQRATFAPLADRWYGGGCQTVGTVKLSALTTDASSLSLTNLGPVTCGTATAFAGWARFGVDRAARAILGSPVVRIETFGSYSCRNVAGTNRRSGHASANAIDVSAFVLGDGRRVSVLDDWSGGTPAERRFLRVVHQSACKRFGTTLGPDYNAAHANHFHLEADGAKFCR